MKKIIVVILTVFGLQVVAVAHTNVVADLKFMYRLIRGELDSELTREEQIVIENNIRSNCFSLVSAEFKKLSEREVTPLAKNILNDSELLGFAVGIISFVYRDEPGDVQTRAMEMIFREIPDSLKMEKLLIFVCDFSAEAFSSKEIQNYLVTQINSGVPAGPFYFVLNEGGFENRQTRYGTFFVS